MPENESGKSEGKIQNEPARGGESKSTPWWVDLLRVAALPLVTLILGFVFNRSLNERQATENAAQTDRQAKEENYRMYTEMMGRREQADSDLRKDMFKSILDTFMSKDPKLDRDEQLRQEVLKLELLAYNFHESLDIGPLFKDVRSRIPDQKEGPSAELRHRLEKVGQEVIERQLTALSDSGMIERGSTVPRKVKRLEAYVYFGLHTVPNQEVRPGEGVSRLCLSLDSTDGVKHYRQFQLEIIDYDALSRQVQVRLYVSQVLTQQECQRADLDQDGQKEIDTNFWVGLFDFPMIDNTRLTHSERVAVSLTGLTPDVLNVVLAYFPGSRASLKDKPYYDEVMHELVGDHQLSEPAKH
jgi:hypothetical protein